MSDDGADMEKQLAAKDEEIKQLRQQLAAQQSMSRQLKAQRDKANDELATAGMQLEAREQMIASLTKTLQQPASAEQGNRQKRRAAGAKTRKVPKEVKAA